MADYLLFESPVGYSIFKVALKGDAVGNHLKEVQEGVNDLAKFGKMVDLASFMPFEYVQNESTCAWKFQSTQKIFLN